MKLVATATAVLIYLGLMVVALATEDHITGVCKKLAQEKKLTGAVAATFVHECVAKAGKK